MGADIIADEMKFQSTSPVWRTTHRPRIRRVLIAVSIHVPRVEDDDTITTHVPDAKSFNPRPPCGGRLFDSSYLYALMMVSIHVPRVEDDLMQG